MALPYGRITGKHVVVNGFGTTALIDMTRQATAEPVFASNTGGGADRDEGNVRLAGQIRCWGHTPPAGVFPANTFALSFTITGVTSGLNGEVASVTAVMCTALEVVVLPHDPQQKNRVYYVVHFGPAGYDMTTSSAGPPPTDTSTPAFYNTKGLSVKLTGVVQDGVQETRLLIRNLAQEDIDSNYNGLWYVPPGSIDWQLTYRRAISALGDLPTLNAVHTVGMMVTSVADWTLSYGRVLEPHGVYDRASNKTIATDITIAKCMNGTNIGSIVDPAGSTRWP